MREKIERVKFLVKELQKHCKAYYVDDEPIISDNDYDKLYDELVALEQETSYIMATSPTQKVQGEVVDKLTKIAHNSLMLSANKTKDINEVIKFCKDKDVVASFKLDGLTIVCKFNNGKFYQAITRGSGSLGEDVTHNFKFCENLPKEIPYKGYLEVRGECVVSWENFNLINQEMEDKYSHPRSLASGSVRQLDSNIAKARHLEYLVFNIVECDENFSTKNKQLLWLENQGFDTVDWGICGYLLVQEAVNSLDRVSYKYPTDGWIFEYNDLSYAKSLGATSHHTNDMIALKPDNELSESVYRGVTLKTSRDGICSITANFDPIEIDGSIVSKASLHNVDIFESYELGIGDTISVYKANLIIPQIDDNLTRSGTYVLPDVCPACGEKLIIIKPVNTRVLYCENPNCCAKPLAKLVNFVAKKALNIDGLSENTLKVFLDKGWVKEPKDLYYISQYKDEIISTDGFGKRSYEKLIEAVEKSRETTLDKFIVGLSIPMVGTSTAKNISNYFHNDFVEFINNFKDIDFSLIKDIGENTAKSIWTFLRTNQDWIKELSKEFAFIKTEEIIVSEDSPFNGKTLVITGSFGYGSRDVIKGMVESLGGNFSSGVSSKTDILLAGTDCGSKLNKALALGIKVMYEDELMAILGK